MRRDPRVWVLGEDVASGGLWGQYKDFLAEFGEQRVVSTPISESTIMGAGLGSALVGMRPIIEMRIFDFVMCAMDELVNQIAKIRYMFGGQAKPAVVVRMPHGMWRKAAEGDAATVVSWSAAMPVATKGAEMLAGEGIKVDLIDLRTIWPWDEAAVIASVKKTGRLLVVHEAVEVAGFGAEIVATVVDR